MSSATEEGRNLVLPLQRENVTRCDTQGVVEAGHFQGVNT